MARPTFYTRYGPWALIAGASQGLGAEFAGQLAARGLNLVLVARRQLQLDELRIQLTQNYSVEVRTLVLDLASEDAGLLVTEAVRELQIGLLVYNAAVSKIGPYFEITLEDHLQELAVNCRTPMMLTYLLGQLMLKRKHGGIVLMSSLGGAQGSPLLANYGATKAYSQILAEGLWDELRRQGIDVVASRPAAISTPGYLASAPSGSTSALTPHAVAADALAALGKRPATIPGWSYRLANSLMQRVLPRKTAIRLMGNVMRTMYGKKATH